MGFTVEALLSSPEFPDLRVVAGNKWINHLIRNVTVIDCPDAFDWLQPGDFVLTSGYIFQNDPALQRKLVSELSELACAGLGVKVKKYWDEVPEIMIQEANKRALPIVTIPLHYTLNQISIHIFKEIYTKEDTLLQKYFKIHKQLIAYSLSEQTLDTIVANAVKLINNPLILLNNQWKLLSYAEHKDNKIPLGKVLNLAKLKPVFSRSFLESIPKDIEDYKKAIKRTCETPYGPVVCRILPVRANTVVYGYLVAWESVRKLRSMEYLGLEQAAIIIALERIKTMRIEEGRRAMRHDFFSDLLEGHIESISSAHSLAEMNGLSSNKRYTCAVIRINAFGEKTERDSRADMVGMDRVQRRLTGLCEEYFQTNRKSACVFSKSNNIIIFLQLENGEDLSSLEANYQDLVQGLYAAAAAMPEKPQIVIGVGCGCNDIVDLKKSFIEAQEAIRISGLMACPAPVNWFEKLMVYNILGSGIPREALVEFYESSVGQLAAYDKENNTNLMDTLEVYLLENGNISLAAKRLYIHRNTMNYRINKIKSVLNTNFDDSEKLLKLQIGIRIMRIINGLGN